MLDLLVIQPTPFCNINCSYCYLPDRGNKARISLETIRQIIQRLKQDNIVESEITVVFHAGEPLVLAASFYREIFKEFDTAFKDSAVHIRYAIQTNGMLINEDWCKLIREYSINIGISIDGPQFLNDKKRIGRNGRGTFDKTMQGIALLKKFEIPYHAIAVITEESLEYALEIFEFFYQNGFYSLGLNIEEQEGINISAAVLASTSENRVKAFYEQMFDLFLKSDRHLSIREFQSSLNSILRNPETIDITQLKIDSHQTDPLGIISVDYLGNYSTYSPELLGQPCIEYDNFILGNVSESGFARPSNTKLLDRMNKEVNDGIAKCKSECSYFPVCGGGAPANKFYENKSFASTQTQYCKYHIQMPVDLVLTYLEKELEIF